MISANTSRKHKVFHTFVRTPFQAKVAMANKNKKTQCFSMFFFAIGNLWLAAVAKSIENTMFFKGFYTKSLKTQCFYLLLELQIALTNPPVIDGQLVF